MEEQQQEFGAYGEQLSQHEKRLDKIDEILEKVRNRPPVWATILIAGLLGVVGWLLNAVNGN